MIHLLRQLTRGLQEVIEPHGQHTENARETSVSARVSRLVAGRGAGAFDAFNDPGAVVLASHIRLDARGHESGLLSYGGRGV